MKALLWNFVKFLCYCYTEFGRDLFGSIVTFRDEKGFAQEIIKYCLERFA